MSTITIRAWWKIRNRRENVHIDYRPKVKKTKENGEGVNDAQKWISWRPSWLTNDDRRRRRFLGVRRRTSGHPLREEGQKRRGKLSGTLPAENTAAQTETPSSSRRLFMYETVAYVHSGPSLPPVVSGFFASCLSCPPANLCVIHTSRLWMMSDVYPFASSP